MAAIFKGSYLTYISSDGKKYNKPAKFATAVRDSRIKAEERKTSAIARAAEQKEAAKRNTGLFAMFKPRTFINYYKPSPAIS